MAGKSLAASASAAPSGWKAGYGIRLTAPAVVKLIGYAIHGFNVLLQVAVYSFDDKTDHDAQPMYSFE